MVEFHLNLDFLVDRQQPAPVIKAPPPAADFSHAIRQALRQPAPVPAAPPRPALPPLQIKQRMSNYVSSPPTSPSTYRNTAKAPAQVPAQVPAQLPAPHQPAPASLPGQISYSSAQTSRPDGFDHDFGQVSQAAPAVASAASEDAGADAQADQSNQRQSAFAGFLAALLQAATARPSAPAQAAPLDSVQPAAAPAADSAIPAQPTADAGPAPAPALPWTSAEPRLLTWLAYLQHSQVAPAAPAADAQVLPAIEFAPAAEAEATPVVSAPARPRQTDQPDAAPEAVVPAPAPFFPIFFPLQAPRPETGEVLNFEPALSALVTEPAETPAISYSYVEQRPLEYPAPAAAPEAPPQVALVPTALEPRPAQPWLLTLLQALAFAAALNSSAQSAQVPAEKGADETALADLLVPVEPPAVPAAPQADLEISAPAPQAPVSQSPAPAASAGPAPAEPAQLQVPAVPAPVDLDRGLLDALASYFQDLLQSQPLSVRPPLAAGHAGHTARPLTAQSHLRLPLLALLPGLSKPPTADQDASSDPADRPLVVPQVAVLAPQPTQADTHADSQRGDGEGEAAPQAPAQPVAVAAPAVSVSPAPQPAAPVASAPQPAAPAAPAVPAAAAPAPQSPVAPAAPAAPAPQASVAPPAAPAPAAPAPVAAPAAPAAPAAAPAPQAPVAPAAPAAPAPQASVAPPAAPAPAAPVPQVPVTPVVAPVAAPAPEAPLQLLSLPQGTLEVQPLEPAPVSDQPVAAPAPAPHAIAAPPRLNLLTLPLGQLQVRSSDAPRQAERRPVYGQLSLEAQQLQAELIQPAGAFADASADQNRDQDAPSSDDTPQAPAFVPPAPAQPFHFRLDSLLAAPKPRLASPPAPDAPAPALSPASADEAQPSFDSYLTRGARQVLRQVEHFTNHLSEPAAKAAPAEAKAAPAAPAPASPLVQSAPLTAAEAIHAINHQIPIADFPAYVNRVLQTMDPGSRVIQSFEVTIYPAELGQVTAQFSLTTQNKMMINLITQAPASAATLEACKQEIQQIVDRTNSLSLGQMTVKQAVASPAAAPRQGANNGGGFGSSQQGTGADYSSRQFRRNNRRRRGDDNLSIDVTI